mmetsp:Transcript_5526/g.34185  ORF Transcript_5526/g.34185 Transcript_5526/m.34185 type:complete len:280 (-) Transcript_5526:159-998(-)
MRHGFRLHGGTGVSSLLHRTLRLVRVLLRLCMRRGLCCNLVALVLLQHSGGSTGRLHGWHLVRGRSHGCLHGNGGPLLHVVRGCVVGVSRLLQLLLLLLWLQVRRRHRPGLWRQVRRGVSLCSRYVSISIRFRILVLRERRRLCLDGSFEGTLRWELDVSGSRDTRRILFHVLHVGASLASSVRVSRTVRFVRRISLVSTTSFLGACRAIPSYVLVHLEQLVGVSVQGVVLGFHPSSPTTRPFPRSFAPVRIFRSVSFAPRSASWLRRCDLGWSTRVAP